MLDRKHAAGRSVPPGRARKAAAGTRGPGSATASPEHCLLIRRHLKTGELAFHYCFVPEGQPADQDPADPRGRAALARGRGLRVSARTTSAWTSARHGSTPRSAAPLVLVMAALAVCAVTAAQLRNRTGAHPPPARSCLAAAPRRPRPDPAHRPRSQAASRRRPQPARPARPRRPLARMDTLPSGTIPLGPPARTPGT